MPTGRECKKCLITKSLSEFEVYNKEKGYRRHECTECLKKRVKAWTELSKDRLRSDKRDWYYANADKVKANVRAWVEANPEKRKKNALSHYYRLQHEVVMAYGGYRCACCGESEPLFLTIDHVNNDGAEHRKIVGSLGGTRLYKWLRDRKFPIGFQVLCMNCNQGRYRNGGICPHKQPATKAARTQGQSKPSRPSAIE